MSIALLWLDRCPLKNRYQLQLQLDFPKRRFVLINPAEGFLAAVFKSHCLYHPAVFGGGHNRKIKTPSLPQTKIRRLLSFNLDGVAFIGRAFFPMIFRYGFGDEIGQGLHPFPDRFSQNALPHFNTEAVNSAHISFGAGFNNIG